MPPSPLCVAGVVESAVSSVVRDILALLNNETMAGTLARDSLKEAMEVPAEGAEAFEGLVTAAMRFLARYGIYACVASDRTVGRILDALAESAGVQPQALVNPWDWRAVDAGVRRCRVGVCCEW